VRIQSDFLAGFIAACLAASLALIASQAVARPFTANDLVMLDRVSEPRLAPDGRSLAFTLRETDLEGNRGLKSIWKLDLTDKAAQPQRLTAGGSNASSARWSPDGRTLYFLSNRSGSDQVWSLSVGFGEARQVTHLPMDVGSYLVAPDGKRLALSLAVFADCGDLPCTKQRLADRTASKESGMVYDRLFVRHWDTWADGTRSQLFIADLAADGTVASEPRLLTRNIDGDVPSKPDGDESEYAFAPDGKSGRPSPMRFPVTGATDRSRICRTAGLQRSQSFPIWRQSALARWAPAMAATWSTGSPVTGPRRNQVPGAVSSATTVCLMPG